jgi:hypothetical protein
VYFADTDPDDPDAGHDPEYRVLHAAALHAEEDPALNNPATDGRQKLPEQQVHLQSPDEVATHVAAESVLVLLEVAALHELTPDTT